MLCSALSFKMFKHYSLGNSIVFGLIAVTLCLQTYEASGGVASRREMSNPFGNVDCETTLNGDEFDVFNMNKDNVKNDIFNNNNQNKLEMLFGKLAGRKGGPRNSITISNCCLNENCLVLKNGETCNEALFPDSLKAGGGYTITSHTETRSWTNAQSGDEPTVADSAEHAEPTESIDTEQVDPENLPLRNIRNSADDQLRKIREKVLKKTNYYRKKHGIKPLVLDDKMNDFAQQWANHLNGNGLSHRPNNAYGENLYATTDSNNVGEKAVSVWYNEIKYFDPNDDENQLYGRSQIHHMTQLLWKSSKRMGVGVSKADNGWYTVVANYDPPGNFGGRFKKNLPKTLFNKF